MKSKTFFQLKTYKDILSLYLTGPNNRGRLTKAAKALNCQRSYLSKVLIDPINITPDLAFGLCDYLNFTNDEREYFMTLVDYERAGNPKLRQHLAERLHRQAQAQEKIPERTGRVHLLTEMVDIEYFSRWMYTAIHLLTSIPEFQTIEAISKRLDLKPELVINVLKKLEANSFVIRKNDLWTYGSGEFHLNKNSPLASIHHQNWRARALDISQWSSDSIHYTSLYTVSINDFLRLKTLCLDFIAESAKIAAPSNPEEGVAILIDFFKI